MPTNNKYSKKSDFKFYQMLGKVTIVVYLHMDKQDLESPIQWLDMVLIKVLYLFHVNKFLQELVKIKIRINNMKLMFQCFKFIMKKFKIF